MCTGPHGRVGTRWQCGASCLLCGPLPDSSLGRGSFVPSALCPSGRGQGPVCSALCHLDSPHPSSPTRASTPFVTHIPEHSLGNERWDPAQSHCSTRGCFLARTSGPSCSQCSWTPGLDGPALPTPALSPILLPSPSPSPPGSWGRRCPQEDTFQWGRDGCQLSRPSKRRPWRSPPTPA